MSFLKSFFALLSIIACGINAIGQSVRINEFMASNSQTIEDAEGDFSDWIELYNASGSVVNLEGWALTDEEGNLQKWIFPSVNLPANGYLVIFASGKDEQIGNEIHTNFKLSADGEYLALSDKNQNIVTELSPAFAATESDQSIGWLDGGWVIFDSPTPGAENTGSSSTELPAPVFSRSHGFYTQSFSLRIDALLQDAKVYYTTDGSEPNTNSKTYSGPIEITGTSIVRAKTINAQGATSSTLTQTYLFVDDIIHQTNEPEGYPDHWGDYVEFSGKSIADYEMDPELADNPAMAERIKEALLSLPVVSLVSDKGNFFSTDYDEETGGIYVFTGPPGDERGLDWERPVSFEYFNRADSLSFQVNCGIKLHGGHSRRPEKSPKHGFRLVFKSKYGPAKLNYKLFEDSPVESFESIILRAGYGNTWIHRAKDERDRAQYGRDTWSKDTELDMGHASSHGNFAHLFINGMYWGIYNPNERIDKDFAEDYLGGNADDYDVIKDRDYVVDGDWGAWEKLLSLVNKGLDDDKDYYYVQGKNADGSRNLSMESYVDTDNLMEYMLLNFYGANWDWDHHNWISVRNRKNPGTGFQFFAWDQEHVLRELDENTTSEFNAKCPSNIFTRLCDNANFKRAFADKVLETCTNNGIFTPEANIQRWMKRSSVLENAIDAESARWGDYRRDVHRYYERNDIALYNKDDFWLPEREFMLNEYFPQRTRTLITQLRYEKLYPTVDAPDYLLNGTVQFNHDISKGDALEMDFPRGKVYYTLDGSDPVSWDGETGTPAENAEEYTESIVLNHSAIVNARCYYGNRWSAMRSEYFTLEDDFNDIRLTEIHYHPAEDSIASDKYEFIELKNTGEGAINLKGLSVSGGISYEFTEDQTLPSGHFAVLASNEKRFYQRYQIAPTGEFKGNLSNGGETIELVSPKGDTIFAITYNDDSGWPEEADGQGPSIVPVEYNPAADQTHPADWRLSYYTNGGSPFNDDDPNLQLDEEKLLQQNIYLKAFPNPFSDLVVFEYEGLKGSTEIAVYNTMGEKVKSIVINQVIHPNHTSWNGTNNAGFQVPAGIYICRLLGPGGTSETTPIRIIKMNE